MYVSTILYTTELEFFELLNTIYARVKKRLTSRDNKINVKIVE